MLGASLGPWKHRSLRFGLGAATVGLTTLFGIIRTKWLASHLDAAGLGVIGQVVAAQTWFGTVASLGLAIPLTRAVAEARGAGDAGRERAVVGTAIGLALPAVVLVAVLMAIGSRFVSGALFGTAEYANLVRIATVGMAGYTGYVLVHGWLAGRADVRAPFAAALAGGLVSVAATIAWVPGRGLAGGVLGNALMTPAAVAGALAFMVLARGGVPAVASVTDARGPRPGAFSLLGVGIAALALAVIDQGMALAVRGRYLRVEGVEANGFVQAALALSQQVGAVLYFYLSSYAFGVVSARPDLAARRDYTRKQWLPFLGLAALACLAGAVLAPWLVSLFYAPSFGPAVPMLRWMLVGELARIATQAWALAALPSGGVRLWLPLMLGFPLSFGIAFAILERIDPGLNGVAVADAIAGIVSFAATGVAMSRHGVTLAPRDVAIAFGALALIVALAMVLPA